MNPKTAPFPRDADEEISALIETLHQTGQRLEDLTTGEVDTVTDRRGRTVLLRRAQDHMRHTEAAKQAAILNALPAHIAMLDSQGRILSVNEAWRRFTGANAVQGPGHEVGLNYLEICDSARGDNSSEAHQAAEGIRSVLSGGARSFSIEYACHSPEEQRWFLLTVTPLADDPPHGAVVMHLNITERKAADTKIQRLTQLYAAIGQCNQAIVRCAGEEELFPKICRVAVQFGGMKMAWIGIVDTETLLVRPVASFGDETEFLRDIEISVGADSPIGRGPTGTAIRENHPYWSQDYLNDPVTVPWRERGARAGWAASASLPLYRNGVVIGAFSLYSGEANAFDESARDLLVEMATDISFALDNFARESHRKLAEEALARESHRNQVFLRNASDGIHILDTDGNVLEVSNSFCEMLGYSRQELIGANVSLWDAQWSPQELKQLIAEQIAKEGLSVLETRHRRRDGSFVDVEITGQGLELDGKPVLFNSARDITKRIRDKRELVESEARFRGLVEQTIAGIYIIQDGKLAYVNPRTAEIVGQGSTDKLIGTDPLVWITEADRGTVAENLRRLIDGEAESLALEFGVLRRDGVVIQVGANAARATHEGRPAIVGLLQDISEKKRADAEIRRYLEQLKTAFMSTVEVATTLSEMRDPYTAGHERRVADLAVAIGAELGFDERRQEGLRVAGHLHDVGKITIPAEILSKPGKLSAIEYQLIQGHAQAGYDVLKGVEFPWPVAQVALQHHERMDGSGYPQRLRGEAILLEARIVAVADVVEAMSSHRPYRPGLGMEKALAEIERGRGSLYDPVVADACLRLFREKGYAISG